MPYISCHEGNIHNTYSQTPHVKQVKFIKYECNGKVPPYTELIPCNARINNNESESTSNGLVFGVCGSILLIYILKKITDKIL